MKLGIDFDHTLISYDALIQRAVVERGYLREDHGLRTKTEIRDALRRQPGGDLRWQRIQSYIYAEGIKNAAPTRDIESLFDFVRNNKVDTWIVSHKTATAPFDPAQRNLREAALTWLERQRFFDPEGLGLSRDRVIFADTFEQKIDRIAEFGFSVFVDDLEEVLRHSRFPAKTRGIHFASGTRDNQFDSWEPLTATLGAELSAEKVSATLEKVGCPGALATRVPGGRNSRCFRAEAGGRRLLVKQYFRDSRDSRNRLETEFSAAEFMWNGGIRCIAEPIFRDRENHSAAYRWIEGGSAAALPATEADVDALVDFVAELQRLRTRPEALQIPEASEACFSLQALDANLRYRRRRLDPITDVKLQEFLRCVFDPAFEEGIRLAEAASSRAGRAPTRQLERRWRILSPSDVGFHNAIRTSSGALAFVDFEYFGWDDPAKLISDFVLQPEGRLSDVLGRRFEQKIFALIGDPELPERYRCLVSLFRLKWVMILLNEFLRVDRARRTLAGTLEVRSADMAERQLEKARKMIQSRSGHADE